VLDQWYEPSATYFKVQSTEGKTYLLRYDEHSDEWTLQSGFDGDSMDVEAQILEIIRDMLTSSFEQRLAVKDITSWFTDRHGSDYDRKITTKWIGSLIRKKLGLQTYKSDGNFIVGINKAKLERLYEKYGLNLDGDDQRNDSPSERDLGTSGTSIGAMERNTEPND
jgi:hypothetical protein